MRKTIFSSLILSLFLVSCGNQEKHNSPRAGVQTVETIKIPKRDVTIYNTYPANIEGVVNVDIRAKIGGYITDVLVDEGQKVRKGQLLFKLETHSLSQEAAAAEANINAAQVQVDQLKPLVEKGIVSNSQLAAAKARLAQAKSQFQTVRANIGYAEIRSPVNGYVGMIQFRKGNLVSSSSTQPLTTVSDISEVYAYFSMNEADYLNFMESAPGKSRADKIKKLPQVSLIMANKEVYPIKGEIETINSQIDKQTGSITFRAVFKNPNHLLTNGSTGEIKIPHVYKDMIIVPQSATFQRQNVYFVVKANKKGDSTFAATDIIEVQGSKNSIYMVSSGLKPGDEIVASNPAKIFNGTPIKAKLVPFDSIAAPLPVVFIKK